MRSALYEFSRNGFHETTVEAVVARARTSKSAFYANFESKEACYLALVDQFGGELMLAVQKVATASGVPGGAIRAGIQEFMRRCLVEPDLGRLLLVQSLGLGGEIEARWQRLRSRFADLIEAEARAGNWVAAAQGVEDVYAWAVVGAVGEVTRQLLMHAGDEAAAATALGRLLG